mgnify:CR=1 FL=1
MSSTVFNIGNKKVTLKYTRKMPRGEVERMKSFVTKNGDKLVKTSKFKILSEVDEGTKRVFKFNKSSFWAYYVPHLIDRSRTCVSLSFPSQPYS